MGAREVKTTAIASMEHYPDLRNWLKQHVQDNWIELVFEEVYTNIVYYAYPSEALKGAIKEPVIEITLKIKQEGVELQFIDEGIPFNLKEHIRQKPNDEPGGYGIILVNKTMDRVDYHRVGNRNILTLFKKATPAS